jgi:hypothetical protein
MAAYRAMRILYQVPRQAARLLQKHLVPVPVPDAQLLSRFLQDLDGDRFAQRERAFRHLENLGDAAEPALRKTLEGKPSLELRRRVEQLLKKLDGPDRVWKLRAVEVLEHLGTPEARRALEALARGAPEAWLTREAQGAIGRLNSLSRVEP